MKYWAALVLTSCSAILVGAWVGLTAATCVRVYRLLVGG